MNHKNIFHIKKIRPQHRTKLEQIYAFNRSEKMTKESEKLPHEPTEEELDQRIIQIVKTVKPKSVGQLIGLAQAVLPTKTEQQILDRILQLQQEEKIRLEPVPPPIPEKLADYLRSSRALWYWVTVATTIATVIVVFTIPEDALPLVYMRYALGGIFILCLPGYAFTKALFPKLRSAQASAPSLKTSEQELDTIERIVLSLGMSWGLDLIVSLLLNYTPWGIRLTPLVVSLLALTMIFSTTAIIREYEAMVA